MTDYKLIASDLDGTLLHSDMTIGDKNNAAIHEISKRGIIFAITSGRTFHEIPLEIRENSDIRYITYSNGTAVYDKEKKCDIVSRRISRKTVFGVLDIISKYDCLMSVHVDGTAYFDKSKTSNETFKKYQINDYYVKILLQCDMCECPEELLKTANGVEAIVFFFADDEKMEECRTELANIGEITVTSSVAHNIEICSANAGKGAALADLAKILGIAREEIIAVGDNMNDTSMYSVCGLSLCTENGNEEAKELADRVICKSDEDVADYILNEILACK